MAYDKLTAPWPGDIEPFPELDDPEKIEREVNTWFTPYLFYRRKSRGKYIELWTTCCLRHEGRELLQRTMTPADEQLTYIRHNDKISCPYCGSSVRVKCLGTSGTRVTLTEYHPVVILQEQNEDIFARAYWVRKGYTEGEILNGPPRFDLAGAYHFSAGHARYYAHFYSWTKFAYTEAVEKYKPKERSVREPFSSGNWMFNQYDLYAVIGLEALERSRFRYCCYADYRISREDKWGHTHVPLHDSLMKYLAVCSFYPRQTEMLMKSGWKNIVFDLVEFGKKNAAAFKWDAVSGGPAAFGLTKPEYRELISLGGQKPEVVAEFKRLKKAGLCKEIGTVVEIYHTYTDLAEIRRACTARGVQIEALARYIKKQGAAKQTIGNSPSRALYWTLDYWSMAEQLGWDLADSTVLWPRDIKAKHDTAAGELTAKKRREAEEADKAKKAETAIRINKWREKYNIEQDGYFIRVAENEKEIIHEGATLKHCVAGYAQRHMEGQCTILFLRRSETPEASLYTIEMDGNRLKQIHGYKNEQVSGKRLTPPREKMAWLLDPWLDWLSRGSPRTKEGKPKLRMKEEKTA